MAHADQMRFFGCVIDAFPQHFAGSVLDIGSLDINGGPHSLISPADYTGVDLDAGPNVNIVSRGEDLDFPTGHFDVTMSSECFEHNPAWKSTLANMIRMTKPGGLVVFSTATNGRPEHGTTRSDAGFGAPLAVAQGQEYYKNVSSRQVKLSVDNGHLDAYFMVKNDRIFDLYFVALKSGALPASLSALSLCEKRVRDQFEPSTSYGSFASFVNNRSRRYIAETVGDNAIEFARRTRARLINR